MTPFQKRMAYVEQGGLVKRMHTLQTVQGQTVAEHSFGVAWWCWLLADGQPSANLLMAALDHDLPEGVTGDIPSPVKKALVVEDTLHMAEARIRIDADIPVFELTTAEQEILEFADGLDLLQYCIRERGVGNRSKPLERMFLRTRESMWRPGIARLLILEELSKQWQEVA